ncbi:hypothetical protein Ocin01_18859 [Orchesella cincta]|uniref:Uncharacterized protein n=1 Tax=Orchesella cincta TaxID=48709 RepID=A0A1D2M4D0_ORCCI|nr:hypothetical protein Ocin01_18859 [Orchesella cincta]
MRQKWWTTCGCLSHRWRPIDALTDQDKKNLVPFGKTEEEILYICVEVILTARSPLESFGWSGTTASATFLLIVAKFNLPRELKSTPFQGLRQ